MRAFLLCLSGMWIVSRVAFADEDLATPAEPGVAWQGSLSVGAELDERGLPTDDKPPAERPARIRVGFSASWSFLLSWKRVEHDSETRNESNELTPEETRLIELTNEERKKLKLPALQADPLLMKMARAHSATMARLDTIGHEIDGKTFSQRMEQAGYQTTRAGENVAQGHHTPAEAIAGWMQSPGHKGNILQADYTRIGVGISTGKTGNPYFTQVFAKPFDPSK